MNSQIKSRAIFWVVRLAVLSFAFVPLAAVGQSGLIGNTNNGSSSDPIWGAGATINAARFQATSNFIVDTVRAKVTAIGGHYKCAIYAGTSATPTTRLAYTSELTATPDGWQTFPLLTPVTLTNANYYWLAIWSDDANARVYYTATTGGTLRWGQYNYGDWPTNLTTTGGNAYRYCIYASGNPPVGPVTVSSVSPLNGAVAVPPETTVQATFNRALNTASITTGTFRLFDATSNELPATVTYNATTFTATLTPALPLNDLATLTARLIGGTNGVKDPYGNSLTNDYTWIFTAAAVPPTMANLLPPAGQAVRSLTQIEVNFSEEVTGVTAADLLINGQPAANVTHAPGWPYVFTFSEPATGTVSVAWAPGHGITDLATPANAFAGGSWSYTLDPNLPVANLVLTEILTANVGLTNLTDEDGDLVDWIELQNRGSNVINLENWSLSDDPDLPGLWTFPARTLNPGQFLVVYASGKDRKPTATNQNLHTNFELSRHGEHLGLYTPDAPRLLASGFTLYPEQRNDVSYGPDPTNALRYFATPTRGASNSYSSIIGVAEAVHANVARGYFNSPFTLVLSCPTPGATIRYSTNGSEPSAASPEFPAALTVSNTLLLRAAAFKTNYLPSKTTTHTYLFNLPDNLRSLPAISIVTATNHLWGPSGIWGIQGGTFSGSDGLWVSNSSTDYHNPQRKGPAWERPTSMEWIEPGDNSGFQADCGIRITGSDYRRPRIKPSTKVSFRLHFRGDYGDARLEYPLFPQTSVQTFDQIVLRSGFDDANNPFVRDEIHRRLLQDMGQASAQGNLAILFLNGVPMTAFSPSNSVYYNPCERIHEEFCQEYFGAGQRWDVVGPYGSVEDGTRTDFNALVSYVSANNPAMQSVYTNIARWLDLTNFADYLILNTYGVVDDWPHNNWRAGRAQGTSGLWRFFVWDAEYGMGLDQPQYGTSLSVNSNPFGSLPTGGGLANGSEIATLYQKLKTSAEFKLLWADRVRKHFFNGGALTRANVTNRMEQLRLPLKPLLPVMDSEFLNWAANRESIYFSQMQTEGLLPSPSAPLFSQHGGRIPAGFALTITQTNSGGSPIIYYTTNGTDPREAFTGNVAATALTYSAPVPINSSLTIKARVKQGSGWSALTDATFTYAALGSPICISEIMYNPTGGSLYEFIELLNPSASPVNLSGWYFNGLTHIFAQGTILNPGTRLILGANTDTNAWQLRYPGANPAGWFSGSLNNAGERLELFDAAGRLITSVDYLDTDGWPRAADGLGNSLEQLNPNGDPNSPANWQASAQTNGTPGAATSPSPAQTILFNEVMADNVSAVTNGNTFPDWVELHNPSGTPTNIANWSLSDDGNARKFVFPANTTVPANGFLVVWCDAATNTTPGLHAGFNLAREGETLSLYNTATSRVDAITIGLQLSNYSVGRLGAGWALTQPTPGATNLAATVAAMTNLSVNEWLANPVAGQPDWIELFNPAAAPVSLQGLYLANSNRLHQLRALSFIPAGGHVQLLADQGVGPNHLNFTLQAAGDRIVLYDNTGSLLQQITFTNQPEGISTGRLPDGSETVASFPGSASPGAANYVNSYTGPVFSELLARNRSVLVNGQIADYIELQNPGAATFDLSGMSISVNRPKVGPWRFPSGTSLAAGARLILLCNGSQPASTNAGNFNLGESLDGESGGAYLFNAAGQLVNSVPYGLQIEDLSIGLSGSQWRLLAAPTPGAANASPAPLSTNTVLRLNEWMANEAAGADWFELYNPAAQPVDLATIALSDDPSLTGKTKFRPAPLSFIAARGFVKWVADASPGQGLNHVNFALDSQGDSLLLHGLSGTNFALLDHVAFGAQSSGVSVGRLLDGATNLVAFPGSPTPAARNYRLLQNIEITEILTHTDPPYEDAVEIRNPGTTPLDIGRWYLSNSEDNLRKYQIPAGTTIPTNSYQVIYEQQFNNASTNSFTFNSAHGDEVWLSAADASGTETGDRLVIRFGAAFNGISFGRVATSSGVDYAPLQAPTFGVSPPASLAAFRTGTGASNTAPLIAAIIINEIFYHPPGGTNGDVEFIELHNRTASPVPLFHPTALTNTWQLADGTSFSFPTNTTLPAGSYALVVDFDPATNAPALADFRARYQISLATPIFGPLVGGLNNTTDDIGLYQPDNPQVAPAPDAGYVPYVRVDRVNYTSSIPWPVGSVSGGSHSLQRNNPNLYGNEALNWFSAAPTPGTANTNPNADTDGDGIPDAMELLMGLNPLDPADAALDADNDGASNYEEYIAGTDHENPNSRLSLNASHTEAGLILSFTAISNRTYSLLSQADFNSPTWSKLLDVPAQPQTVTVTVTNASTNAAHFYRLATPALAP